MILYFSATGNCEYVARNLGDLINDSCVDMGKYLKEEKVMELNSEKPYVIIAPVYISTMPVVILDLLKKSKLEGNKNVYVIMTCAGSGVSGTGAFVRPAIEGLGLTYRGIAHLSMPQNYLMFFTVKEKEENEVKFNEAIAKIPALADKINNDEDFDTSKVGAMHKMSVKPTIWIFDKFCIKPKKFYVTDECVGCSLCEKLCPLNNIKMVDGKPVWGKTCVHCTACINKCPKKAIEYGKKTQGKNRYIAPKYKSN